MAPIAAPSGYSDALIVLGTAAFVVPLVRRWGISPVLGYLGAGAILGPLGLGSFGKSIPIVGLFTVSDAQNVAGIAALGVAFLLFSVGLELSVARLSTMRRMVLGLGGSQILLTSAVIAGLAVAVGLNPTESVLLGACLSLSSTAIVLELLSVQERLTTGVGRASFSILLAQDLAVVPILVFVSIQATRSGQSLFATLATALLQAATAIIIIAIFGRFFLRPLFRLVATARTTELFVAAVLFVIIAAGLIAEQARLSMALGAFIAGLLLAETEYRKAIEMTVGPFKGLLLGIFFFTVGMNVDFREVLREPLLLVGGVVGLIALKAVLLIVLGKFFRLSWPVAVETGLLLGPGGEFAFVGIGMAAAVGLVEARLVSLVLTVTSVTMALTPLLSVAGRQIAGRLVAGKAVDAEITARPTAGHAASHRRGVRPRRESRVRVAAPARYFLHRRRLGRRHGHA